MTQIPDHLLKRADAARAKNGIQSESVAEARISTGGPLATVHYPWYEPDKPWPVVPDPQPQPYTTPIDPFPGQPIPGRTDTSTNSTIFFSSPLEARVRALLDIMEGNQEIIVLVRDDLDEETMYVYETEEEAVQSQVDYIKNDMGGPATVYVVSVVKKIRVEQTVTVTEES